MYKSITLDCQTTAEKLNCQECIAYKTCTTKQDGKDKTLAQFYHERDLQEQQEAAQNVAQTKKVILAALIQ